MLFRPNTCCCMCAHSPKNTWLRHSSKRWTTTWCNSLKLYWFIVIYVFNFQSAISRVFTQYYCCVLLWKKKFVNQTKKKVFVKEWRKKKFFLSSNFLAKNLFLVDVKAIIFLLWKENYNSIIMINEGCVRTLKFFFSNSIKISYCAQMCKLASFLKSYIVNMPIWYWNNNLVKQWSILIKLLFS